MFLGKSSETRLGISRRERLGLVNWWGDEEFLGGRAAAHEVELLFVCYFLIYFLRENER